MIKFEIENTNQIVEILDKCAPSKIIISLRGDYEKQTDVVNEIIKYSKETNSKVYFVSTWNVFDEYPDKLYYENDERLSDTDYGKFKINAENLLINNIDDKCIIFRLPMIWGKNSPRLSHLKKSLENKEPIEVATNMFLNNNTDEMIARQIIYIIENYSNGIFHLGSIDEINHYDFIKSIISKLGYENIEFEEVQYGDGKYTATLGSIKKLPEELQIYNKDIIESLI